MAKYSDLFFTWFGDVTSYSGWAQHARGIIRPLVEGGAQIRLEMIKPGRPETKLDKWWEDQFPILTKASPGVVKICHGDIALADKCGTSLPVILSTHWETREVPNGIVSKLNRKGVKAIVVPNKDMMSMIDDKITAPSFVVDCPVNVKELKNLNPLEMSGIDSNTVVFGAVGEWNNRHNMSDTVVAFLKAFTSKDNVALVLKTFGQNISSLDERQKMLGLIRQIKRDTRKPNLPNIVLVQDALSYTSMNSLLARINIYVSASRGASKDISAMKCAAMGKQCIVPGHTVYNKLQRKSNPESFRHIYFVDYFYEPVILSVGHYNINDSWARIDLCQLAELMHTAYTDLLLNSTETLSQVDTLTKMLNSQYSPERCAVQMANLIREVSKPIPVVDFVGK